MSGSKKKIKVYRNTSNKIFGEHMQHSSIKIMCNQKILRFSRAKQWHVVMQDNGKEMYKKVLGTCKFVLLLLLLLFFSLWLIRLTDLVVVLIAVAAYHCTILFFLLISILTRASLLALAKSIYIILYILLYIKIYMLCKKTVP